MSFANQVVLITGASSGIGAELARQLAAQGARVGLVARRRDKLEALAAEIAAKGGTAVIAPADAARRDEMQRAAKTIREQLGPVDLMIASAGVSWMTNLDQSNIGEIEETIQINVLGVIYAIEAVLPQMLQRRRGHIAAPLPPLFDDEVHRRRPLGRLGMARRRLMLGETFGRNQNQRHTLQERSGAAFEAGEPGFQLSSRGLEARFVGIRRHTNRFSNGH